MRSSGVVLLSALAVFGAATPAGVAGPRSAGPVAAAVTVHVQGTVTDEGYFPIASADLDIRPAGERDKLNISGDNTNGGGAYSIAVPPGTYDISASGPPGSPYAAVTARSIVATSDPVAVPNLILPQGFELRAICRVDTFPVAGVDVDVDSLPYIRRLETKNGTSDGTGLLRVMVSAWKFRVTLSPPVSAKLLPMRFDSLQINGATNLDTVRFARGHWVSGRVLDSGSNISIHDANLDFIRVSNGVTAITPGDRTDTSGTFKVVTDQNLYRVRVIPPSVQWDTLVIQNFRTLNDTTVTLRLNRRAVSVPPGAAVHPSLSLSSPLPNPSRGDVAFSFQADGWAELLVCDLQGRRIATLFRGPAERRGARWSGVDDHGRSAPPGVYLVRLTDGRRNVSRRFTLVR